MAPRHLLESASEVYILDYSKVSVSIHFSSKMTRCIQMGTGKIIDAQERCKSGTSIEDASIMCTAPGGDHNKDISP